jgi:hypothetical protein
MKWKARIVAGGNNVRNSQGQHVVDAMETAPPASLEGIRCVIVASLAVPGGDVFQVNIEAAYLHAPLVGPKYFVELPKALWPKAWLEAGYSRPVLPLLKALPGLTQSGCLWHSFADGAAVENGWHHVMDVVDDVYVKEPGHDPLLLAMYVDDMLIGGKQCRLQAELDLLDRAKHPDKDLVFDIGQSGPLQRYLGCDYERTALENGMVLLTCSQKQYIESIVAKLLVVANKTHLRKVLSPLPCEQPPHQDYEVDGHLEAHAAELIGALLWVARCSRPDISFAVSFLARFTHRWSVVADRYLERVVAYLATTSDFVLASWVSPGDMLQVSTFADADHAGCPFSARSTSGAATYLTGSQGTQALVSWSSHRQSCTAASTGEAELVALTDACRRATMPIVDMLGQVYGRDVKAIVHTDSAAALAALQKGASSNMRYLRKNHRVSLGCARDYILKVGIEHGKVDGDVNVADIFTKPLGTVRHQALTRVLGVVPPGLLREPPMALC